MSPRLAAIAVGFVLSVAPARAQSDDSVEASVANFLRGLSPQAVGGDAPTVRFSCRGCAQTAFLQHLANAEIEEIRSQARPPASLEHENSCAAGDAPGCYYVFFDIPYAPSLSAAVFGRWGGVIDMAAQPPLVHVVRPLSPAPIPVPPPLPDPPIPGAPTVAPTRPD